MNTKEYLLLCLSEECAEVAHRVSKALRFTVEEVQPGDTLSNAERVTSELIDLIAVVEMLIDEGVITDPRGESAGIIQKKHKIQHYMKYSQKVGTLDV